MSVSAGAKARIALLIEAQGAKRAQGEVRGVTGATNQLGNATERAAGKTRRARAAAASFTTSLGRMARAMKFGAIAGAGMATVFGKQSVDATMDLGKATLGLQRITGLDTKTASAWVEVAKMRGIEAAQLSGAFGRLDKQMLAAKSGNKAALGTFKQLGVGMEAIKSGNPDLVMKQMADRFAEMKNPADKAALAMSVFGRGAALKMLPLLNKGSKGIGEMQQQLIDAGATLDDTKSIEEQIAAQRQFKISMEGLKITFGKVLIPALAAGMLKVNDFVALVRENWPRLKAYFAPTIAFIGGKIDWLRRTFQGLSPQMKTLAIGIAAAFAIAFGGPMTMIAALGVIVPWLIGHWEPIKAYFSGLWTKVGAAFATGVAWIKKTLNVSTADLKRFWAGAQNAFRWGAAVVKVAIGALVFVFTRFMLPTIRRALAGVVQTLRGVALVIGGIIKVVGAVLTGNWRKAWQGVKQIVRGGVMAVVGLLRSITAPARQVGAMAGRYISGPFNTAKDTIRRVAGAIVTTISSLPGRLASGAKGMWNFLVDGMKGAVNKVIGMINSMLGALRSIKINIPKVDLGPAGSLGGGSISLPVPPDIPALAKGGTIVRDGLVVVGEHGPELREEKRGAVVTPNRDLPKVLGGTDHSGPVELSDSTLARLAALLMAAMEAATLQVGVKELADGVKRHNARTAAAR